MYSYFSGGEFSLAAAVALGIFIFVFLILGLVLYVLKSLGLYTLALNRNLENPWLAWIPIADLYILGSLVGEMEIFGYRLPSDLGLVTLAVMIGGFFLSMIPFLGVVFSLAVLVFIIFLVYNLFQIYAPNNAVLFTILSFILGLFAVFVFVIRNNQPQKVVTTYRSV